MKVQQQQQEWQEVTPVPREWDSEFCSLEKGDTLQGWLIGTRIIRDEERYLVAVEEDGAWKRYILPQHALLEARLAVLTPPALVRIENLGLIRLPSGRRAYSYKVLHRPNAPVPVAVQEFVQQLAQSTAPPF